VSPDQRGKYDIYVYVYNTPSVSGCNDAARVHIGNVLRPRNRFGNIACKRYLIERFDKRVNVQFHDA